jgi:hypothetical protein
MVFEPNLVKMRGGREGGIFRIWPALARRLQLNGIKADRLRSSSLFKLFKWVVMQFAAAFLEMRIPTNPH